MIMVNYGIDNVNIDLSNQKQRNVYQKEMLFVSRIGVVGVTISTCEDN